MSAHRHSRQWSFISGRRRVVSLSLMPTGDSVVWGRRELKIAKPMLYVGRASQGSPFQKNVYPPPTKCDSDSVAALYLQSSAATGPVRHAVRSEFSLSRRVYMFQVANRSGLRIDVRGLQPQGRDAQWTRLPVPEMRNGQCLGHIF